MARARHARPSWWRAWLRPDRTPAPSWRDVHARSLVRLCDDVSALQDEVAALRASSQRSTAAEVVAELRAQRLEEELVAVRAEAAALRRDLDAVREELVWAFAERRMPVDPAPVQHLRVARRSG